MKVRKIKYSLFASMMAVVAVFLASCEDTLEIGKLPDESQYEDIYAKNGYLRDAKSNRVTNIIDLFTENYKTSVRLGLTKAPTVSSSVKVEVDAAYLEAYNKEHETTFKLFPKELITLGDEGLMTINPDSKTAELSLSVTGGEALEEDVTYAIPLTVNEAGSDIQFNNEESRHCMYFVNDMRKKGDVFKGEDKPKGFLFIEVNDVNPLNALSFQLENGKYLWDAVVLFAANINYDAASGRPYVKCNPNVQYLLDNNETLIQPLRKRGIKVILGILGNHDMAGVAQLSPQGCKDFARELARYCYAYDLDGVNFDDEWSDPNVDVNNPSFAFPSYEAGARLCLETKRAMPDKLVTVFCWDKMHSLDQVDGVDAKEYTDIAVANYGSTAPALGQMTLKQCSGVSSEYNERRGGDLNASTAQRLMNDGYGWFMGFAPFPNNYNDIWKRLEGAEVLYGSPLKEPSLFYKKNATEPSVWPNDL